MSDFTVRLTVCLQSETGQSCRLILRYFEVSKNYNGFPFTSKTTLSPNVPFLSNKPAMTVGMMAMARIYQNVELSL